MNKLRDNIKFELYLIRHAESLGNIRGVKEGSSVFEEENSALSDLGKIQADLLAKRFSSFKLDCVLSSPLIRTVSTAAEIIKHQPKDGADVLEIYPEAIECGFHEIDMKYGLKEIKELTSLDISLKMAKDIEETKNLMYPSILNTKDQEYERGLRLGNYLKNRFNDGEDVALVAHGAFNAHFLKALLYFGLKREMHISSFNTSVTRVIFYKEFDGLGRPEFKLSYLNDTSHLFADFPEVSFI